MDTKPNHKSPTCPLQPLAKRFITVATEKLSEGEENVPCVATVPSSML